MKRMHTQWISRGMKSISAQRLTTQVRNIRKKAILSQVERQQIHRKVIGEVNAVEDEDVDTTTISDNL